PLALEEAFKADLLAREGKENLFLLHEELSEWMVRYVTVKRDNQWLQKTINKIKELRERYKNIDLNDRSHFANQSFQFAHQFQSMLELALVMTKGALLRNEFRGSHFKPEFPERDDKHWLKTTIATYAKDEPIISYEAVDMRHLAPQVRDYRVAKRVKPELTHLPTNIRLPL